jgi:hypothetical protein
MCVTSEGINGNFQHPYATRLKRKEPLFCHGTNQQPASMIQTHLYLIIFNQKIVVMTEFSKSVVSCLTEWGKTSAACNGNIECLEQSARQLRECLDAAFPDSKKIELESDKVNYMLSSVFFLANRLSKAIEGLAEFDRVMNSTEKMGKVSIEEKENQEMHTKFQQELDDILAKYF